MAKKPSKDRTAIPANETPGQRFDRLAQYRVNRALFFIRSIGNLAGSGYESTPDKVDAIYGALTDETASVIAALKSGGKKKVDLFTFGK